MGETWVVLSGVFEESAAVMVLTFKEDRASANIFM
jgi:hypothetical protein